jgi:Zn-dependent protease with chaperone function
VYYGLAIVLCLAVLFIVLAGASLFCAAGLWMGIRLLKSLAPRTRANLLFGFRVLPLFLALLITVGFVLPAFLRFEPRSSGEMIGLRLLGLAGLGGVLLAAIAIRTLKVVRATIYAQRQWLRNSTPVKAEQVQPPVYCIDAPAPLLAVTGIFQPRIFVARTVAENLSMNELSAAIAHEMAHVNALDNLKQLVLKISRPPRWLNIFRNSDTAWLTASEMAADEGAVAKGASSLELSSALVKVGRLSRQAGISSLIAASHLLPAAAESCIEMRVMHLQKLLENDELQNLKNSDSRLFWISSFAVAALAYVVCMNAILPWMHEALELLVR